MMIKWDILNDCHSTCHVVHIQEMLIFFSFDYVYQALVQMYGMGQGTYQYK